MDDVDRDTVDDVAATFDFWIVVVVDVEAEGVELDGLFGFPAVAHSDCRRLLVLTVAAVLLMLPLVRLGTEGIVSVDLSVDS